MPQVTRKIYILNGTTNFKLKFILIVRKDPQAKFGALGPGPTVASQ